MGTTYEHEARESNTDTVLKTSNVLDVLDQRTFDLGLAIGVNSLLQSAWIYDRPVDIEGLRQFHDHLRRGRLSRGIERSPLPFGRHRWVASDNTSELEIVETPRPREEFDDWLGEQINTPLDCERGPGWHLAMLPFTDGGSGVSLVVSHCLIDGVGLCEALADAALGRDDPISWPAAETRGRWRAVSQDAWQTVRDIPAMARGVVAAIRLARRSREGATAPATSTITTSPAPAALSDESIPVPMATILVDADEWDSRAEALGGTSNTLLVGLAARLAHRAGRVGADGSVVVMMPVNQRADGDTRANARSSVAVTVDPALATTDLREIRAAVKETLIRHGQVPDEEHAVNAIIPFLPKRFLGATSRVGSPNQVGSSNLGVVNPAATRADGTEADHFAVKVLPYLGLTEAMLHRFGGTQSFLSGRANGRVFVSAHSYLPGGTNSNERLRQNLSNALNDFSLTGTLF
ncbi:wax ester/triacylglycerol synthase domain-containing protein [Mycolicibacterium fortuitum]|uniref:wax ester/triacylglycerol synthase domain-containing protein n=1 Tax=Mycolicibacterium fortuitum TaxID=1766 RepID=UPI0007E984F8|nr:wax ester/triacylglycerol synthase domain-containing protein [Mycolicibacterium fortuitum]NOQ62691.1 hypothetical protein [Mycolicibacterium fortuitum]NOR04645.1 hypothetical protein [Mycolicibacterium fortuitum]OBG42433.1 hypothetical protein A5670_15375 [Mycolicibacterium fortuitum]OBI67429.1 hypothetical protein A5664_13260 [Mycolicibacterium fortuitum]